MGFVMSIKKPPKTPCFRGFWGIARERLEHLDTSAITPVFIGFLRFHDKFHDKKISLNLSADTFLLSFIDSLYTCLNTWSDFHPPKAIASDSGMIVDAYEAK